MSGNFDRLCLFFARLFIVIGVLFLIKEAAIYGIVRIPVLFLIACGAGIHLIMYIAKKLTERACRRIAELDSQLEALTKSEDP